MTEPAPTLTRARVPLALATVYVVWGATYLALRIAVQTIPPLLLGGARYTTAGLILLVALRLRGEPLPSARQWALSVPLGALLFLVGNGFVAIAEVHVSSSVAAVVCATTPLAGSLVGLFFGERPRPREWAGLALGFAGVVMASLGDDLRGRPAEIALLVGSPFGWAVASHLVRRLPMPAGGMAAAAPMLAGGATMAACGLVRGEAWPASIPLQAAAAAAFLVLFGSVAAFTAYTFLLRATRPSVAMSHAYVNPIVAVALGAALGGESLSWQVFGATALVAAGVALILRPRGARLQGR